MKSLKAIMLSPIENRDAKKVNSSREWRLWTCVGVATASTLLVALAFIAIVKWFVAVPVPTGIQTIVLPDRSSLVLREVTFGTHHQFRVENQDRFFRKKQTDLSESTKFPSAVLWFSYHGLPQLDRWAWSSVTDDLGQEHWVARAGHAPLSNFTVVRAVLPQMRISGATFKFRLFEQGNEQLAEFEVPNPFATTVVPEKWEPDPLPITKSVTDDVTLSLEGITARPIPSVRPARFSTLAITPRTQFQRNGQSTDDWEIRFDWLMDPLGHSAPLTDCPFSTREPAWQVSCHVQRRPGSELPPDTVWDVGEVAIPAVGEETPIGQSRTLVDYQIEVSGLKTFASSEPAGTEAAKMSNDLSISYLATWNIEAHSPSDTSFSSIELCVFDEQGQRIERNLNRLRDRNDYSEWFQIPKSMKKVRLRIVRNSHYVVKFLVKPPQPSIDSKP